MATYKKEIVINFDIFWFFQDRSGFDALQKEFKTSSQFTRVLLSVLQERYVYLTSFFAIYFFTNYAN